jgi:hypothetical protein
MARPNHSSQEKTLDESDIESVRHYQKALAALDKATAEASALVSKIREIATVFAVDDWKTFDVNAGEAGIGQVLERAGMSISLEEWPDKMNLAEAIGKFRAADAAARKAFAKIPDELTRLRPPPPLPVLPSVQIQEEEV